jgi:beta-lactamase regulating signal transducer with metallopeptidase domain
VRLILSSVLLGLVWFTATNAAASAAAWLLGRSVIRRPSPSSASLLLAVRLLPAVASSVFVGAVFLPTHWRFEPVESDESFGVVLAAIAAIGLLLILRALGRAVRAGAAGRRLAAVARRAASLPDGEAVDNAIRVIDGLPGVSLFGIWRPRILIGADARGALTPAELDLAISHEVAHRRAKDNLKRLLICCAPDLFSWTRVARELEDRWQGAAECDADAHAVRGDSYRAVLLASALVKVARLGRAASVSGVGSAAISSAFHVPTLLETRVRRLVSGGAPPPAGGQLVWSSATLSVGISAALWLLGFSGTLHSVTEAMVAHLP